MPRPDHGARNGLLIGFAIVALIALVTAPFSIFIGPGEEQYGRVLRLGSVRKGGSPAILAQIQGKPVWLRPYHRLDCDVGDQVQVYHYTTVIRSHRYKVGPRACLRRG